MYALILQIVETWDHKRHCWTEATFLRRTNNFFDVKNHITGLEETSNLGLTRRPLKVLVDDPLADPIEI